jgi:uncharacterized protein YbaA (DUF1428 family)
MWLYRQRAASRIHCADQTATDLFQDGRVTDFRRAVQATAEETVAFAWVEWPDKATRDAAMKKMVEDPRMDPSTPGNPPCPSTASA